MAGIFFALADDKGNQHLPGVLAQNADARPGPGRCAKVGILFGHRGADGRIIAVQIKIAVPEALPFFRGTASCIRITAAGLQVQKLIPGQKPPALRRLRNAERLAAGGYFLQIEIIRYRYGHGSRSTSSMRRALPSHEYFLQYGGGIPAGGYMVHTAVVGGKVNVISVGAVNFPHAGGIAHHHAWSTAGNGFQRGDAEPLIQRGGTKTPCSFPSGFWLRRPSHSQGTSRCSGGPTPGQRPLLARLPPPAIANITWGLLCAARSTQGKFLFLSRLDIEK